MGLLLTSTSKKPHHMSVPVTGFIPHLCVYCFNDGEQSSSEQSSNICVWMGRWLSAEHGALLSMREVTLRGVRAGRGEENKKVGQLQLVLTWHMIMQSFSASS